MTSEENEKAIKVWLEEYKTLTADVQSRVALQHGLMNYLLLVLSAAVVILTGMLKDNLLAHYLNELRYLLLVLPILFSFFVLRHANHDINIIDKAAYIHHVIRPNLVALTGDSNILGFERYLERSRQRRNTSVGALIWLGSEHVLHLLLSLIALVIAICAFFSRKGTLKWFSSTEEAFQFVTMDILLLLDIILFVMSVNLKIRVASAYGSVVAKTGEIWS